MTPMVEEANSHGHLRRPRTSRSYSSWLIIGALFVSTSAAFWFSPVRQMTDSRYSLLVSQSLLDHQRFDLDDYKISRAELHFLPGLDRAHTLFHQLTVVGAYVYYNYPPGSSVLSVPFVALMNVLGVYTIHRNGVYLEANERRMQALLAAMLMASLSCVFFLTARMMLSTGWSLMIAFTGAFGTQVWSTASRALWSHTWGIFLLGVARFLLVLAETRKRELNAVLVATLLSWMFIVRPTYIASILAITCYVALYHRRQLIRFVLTGVFWSGILLFYFYSIFGTLIPHRYDLHDMMAGDFWPRMAYHLVSPSRGLVVFVPVLLFVAYALTRYSSFVCIPRLVTAGAATLIAHLVILCSTSARGGNCYGPRQTSDLVPWFVLLGTLSVDALLRFRHENRIPASMQRIQTAVGILLVVLSVLLNSRGALAPSTARWNSESKDEDVMERASRNITARRFWDWKNAQFLAGLGLFAKPQCERH